VALPVDDRYQKLFAEVVSAHEENLRFGEQLSDVDAAPKDPGDVLKGESPFTLPAPVFRSPRDLRRLLGLKVKRNWHQPEAVVLAKAAPSTTSLLCPHFRGSIARLTQLGPGMQTFRTDPPIPDRDPLQTRVRIC